MIRPPSAFAGSVSRSVTIVLTTTSTTIAVSTPITIFQPRITAPNLPERAYRLEDLLDDVVRRLLTRCGGVSSFPHFVDLFSDKAMRLAVDCRRGVGVRGLNEAKDLAVFPVHPIAE